MLSVFCPHHVKVGPYLGLFFTCIGLKGIGIVSVLNETYFSRNINACRAPGIVPTSNAGLSFSMARVHESYIHYPLHCAYLEIEFARLNGGS